MHNVLQAHAAAVQEFRLAVPGGKISINLNCDWGEPYSNSEADKVLAFPMTVFGNGACFLLFRPAPCTGKSDIICYLRNLCFLPRISASDCRTAEWTTSDIWSHCHFDPVAFHIPFLSATVGFQCSEGMIACAGQLCTM